MRSLLDSPVTVLRCTRSKGQNSMKRIFFSQGMLDSMVDAGKIKVDKSVLTMLAGDNPTFELKQAYRFVRTIDNATDPNGFVGQIRSEAELKELGAEIYMDSIIYRDVAYQADPGYIAEKKVPGAPPDAVPAERAAAPVQQPAEPPVATTVEPPADKASEADQLSKFVMDNLL
jgi:hypothetical protein